MKYLICFLSFLCSINLYSQTFISDKQSTIANKEMKIQEYSPHERKIILDSINGTIKIELLDGTFLKRNIKFVSHVYESYGIVYNGYYKTPQEEKIYIRNNEIGFHAIKTLGYFITYYLNGTKQPTKEEAEKESEKSIYESTLQMYGKHDADCYKYKRIETGIDELTVKDILGDPVYEELFGKKGEFINIIVYPSCVVRTINMKVDKIIKFISKN
jgi:hypothetical protein